MAKSVTLTDYLTDDTSIPRDVADVVLAIGRVGQNLSRRIARGVHGGDVQADFDENTDDARQNAMDTFADDMVFSEIAGGSIKWLASIQRQEVIAVNSGGALALAINTLDGSANIEVNAAVGTIFSIYPAKDDADESFLRPGCEQLAGGYIIYGPQTALMVTFGGGTLLFFLDPDTREFVLKIDAVKIPEASSEFAIDASNYRHWTTPVRAYIDDAFAGETGPRGKNFNMLWVGSLVAETYRIITRGGIYFYPGDAREGYEQGRLRLIHECAPIAFLIEQAGGHATDGCDRLLDQKAKSLHARTPLVFGTADKVDRVATYHDLPEHETSALFRERGLYRN